MFTFARTEFEAYKAGDSLRLFGPDQPYGTGIILGFTEDGTYCRIARPYAYADCVGTTSPGVLMGCETFMQATSGLKHYVHTVTQKGAGRFVTNP